MATIEELLAMLERKPASMPTDYNRAAEWQKPAYPEGTLDAAPAINPPAGKKGISFEMDPVEIPGAGPAAPVSAPMTPQVQPLNVIKSDMTPEPIVRVQEQPVTPLGEFIRENRNKSINADIDYMVGRQEQELEASKDVDAGKKMLLEQYNNPVQLPEKQSGADAEIASLQKQYEELQRPSSPDMTTELINALGPALLAIGFGGGGNAAAAQGGVSSFAQGQTNSQNNAKIQAEERRAKILAGAKRLEGAAALKKAELDGRSSDFKNNLDLRKLQIDLAKSYMDAGMDREKAFIQSADEIKKLSSQNNQLGINSVADTENKALDRLSREEIAALNAKSAEERAKIAGKAKTAAPKPSNADERKSAAFYGALKQATTQYDDLIKKSGGKLPSETMQTFDKAMQVIGGQQGTTLMGEAFKALPGWVTPDVRQQISNEFAVVDAVLRPKTGAAITVQEYLSKSQELFPRRGDSPEEKARKRARIEQEMINLSGQAGRAPLPEQAVVQPVGPQNRDEKLKRLQELESMP